MAPDVASVVEGRAQSAGSMARPSISGRQSGDSQAGGEHAGYFAA
jgi:hypothetical protein